MLSKEEYLDNLLKGIAEQESQRNKENAHVEEEIGLFEEPMPELTMEEPEVELSAEPEEAAALDVDLDAMLESVPELTMEEGLGLPEETVPELAMEDEEEPEVELSAEPKAVVVDADLDALLESVPELAMEEGLGLPEEIMPELAMEEGINLPEIMPELAMEEGVDLPEIMPELTMEEGATVELSSKPEAAATSEADLDALLKSVAEMAVEEETELADNLDSYTDIGDDIEARLDMAAELPPVTEEFPEDDVMSMLEESDDSDLQEIQDLLQKSDSNEAVDSSVEELLKELPEEDLEAKILGDSEESAEISAEETPAERRRRAKEEKARAKAEKKAEAAARKAAKKAEKEAAKREKTAAGRGQTQDQEEGQAFDPAILDSIVSEAGMAGIVRQDEEQPVDILGDMTEGGEEEIFNPLAEADEVPEPLQPTEEAEAEESDDLDVDFDNIFGSEEEDGVDFSEQEADQDASDDQKTGEKKKGFFSRILDFLTEEEDEADNENIQLSQENQDILNELDKEKGKKKKGKKGKKGKGSEADDAASEKGAKGKKAAKTKKAAKPKKPPKPKKEKPSRETPLIPERKLTFKRMLPVLLMGVSVGVLLFVFVNATVDFTDKKTARDAFYAGDYQTCYQNLFGKDLNETESIMFGKSKSILYIRLWIREYQMFAEEGDRVRGLDSLIQTVAAYPELYEYAQQWNAEEEVAAGYATVLNLLRSEYGLSESQALEISKIWRDVDYTRAVIAAAEGNYGSNIPNKDQTGSGNHQGDTGNSGENQLPDFLPEEEDLGGQDFHDNQ